ncbi:MAG: dihydroorotate dehydrogenase-like protein [Vicinamibacterales bacterium]
MILTTSYLGLKLAHPFILGASPVTGHLDSVRRAEDGGCAAIVMHSLFEEQIAETAAGMPPGFEQAARELLSPLSHFSRPDRFPLGSEEYLEQLRRIKTAVSVPVVGSLNGFRSDGWLTYARLIEEAGADALELNVYNLSTSVHDSSTDIEARIESLVRKLKALVRIPIAVKLSPFFTAFGALAVRLEAAGADGLVFFNRYYQPDVDIDTLETLPNLHLSTSAELLLRLRWLGILSEHVKMSLAVTGGVHSVRDGVKAVLSGAHVVQMVSSVLQQGPQLFREMEQGLSAWMTRHKYDSIDACRGSLNLSRYGDPTHFERLGYFRMLHSWSQ